MTRTPTHASTDGRTNARTEDEPRTMRDVSHTNPYTGDTAGHLFRRGPVVAADGGRREAVDDADDESEAESKEREATMEDVSHTPPNESEDANRVFERGGSEDDVEYEE